jgi:glyoxylase-like metal-dependent hydrolase (beta-lactamase superfamily II)
MANPASNAQLSAKVFVGRTHGFEDGSGTFSPTTSTLIMGRTDAVLVDAQHIREDIEALVTMIAQSGRRLTTIYITHGHADHWYGAGEIMRRFPSSRPVATAGVVDYIERTRETSARSWRRMFGDRVVIGDALPSTIQGSLDLEGHELLPIEVGQADIAPSTVLHVPSIGLVVTGDVIYNRIHVMLGLTGPAEWDCWIDSVGKVERLAPNMLVAGHKRPEASDSDVARMIDETRSYIRAFADAAREATNADEIVGRMTALYPNFGNLWTLQFSATAYCERRS